MEERLKRPDLSSYTKKQYIKKNSMLIFSDGSAHPHTLTGWSRCNTMLLSKIWCGRTCENNVPLNKKNNKNIIAAGAVHDRYFIL